MGQTVNVNFKLDADVKKGMETACSDMGLSMSAAFTIFEKKWHEKNVYHLKYLRIHFTLKVICAILSKSRMTLKREKLPLLNMI